MSNNIKTKSIEPFPDIGLTLLQELKVYCSRKWLYLIYNYNKNIFRSGIPVLIVAATHVSSWILAPNVGISQEKK